MVVEDEIGTGGAFDVSEVEVVSAVCLEPFFFLCWRVRREASLGSSLHV